MFALQFLPLRDFDDVTGALNFDTPDCRVVGGCDLYTTKAAGSDKKLYRNIDKSLETQYESLLRLSASLSPPRGQSEEVASMNLSRSSPFGPLSQISSRRAYAYLLATLNASHPDYDFSHILRPSDFRKERSLKGVMNTIDSTLYGIRPSHQGNSLHVPPQTTYAIPASAPVSSQAWGPTMWNKIDKEMTLDECTVYCWDPSSDPFDGEEGAIWSLNYFFFNKQRKRVAYIYLRGIPVMSHSPRSRNMAKRTIGLNADMGAGKRAGYWLGDHAQIQEGDENQDEDSGVGMWSDEIDKGNFDGDDFCDDYDDMVDDDSDVPTYEARGRDMSQDHTFAMDIDD